MSGGDGSCGTVFWSSFWRFSSPFKRPLPPMISKRLNLAVGFREEVFGGVKDDDDLGVRLEPRKWDLCKRGPWRLKEEAIGFFCRKMSQRGGEEREKESQKSGVGIWLRLIVATNVSFYDSPIFID